MFTVLFVLVIDEIYVITEHSYKNGLIERTTLLGPILYFKKGIKDILQRVFKIAGSVLSNNYSYCDQSLV